jgi:hypothetical protein
MSITNIVNTASTGTKNIIIVNTKNTATKSMATEGKITGIITKNRGAGVVVGTTTDMGTNIITKVIPTNTEKNLQLAV